MRFTRPSKFESTRIGRPPYIQIVKNMNNKLLKIRIVYITPILPLKKKKKVIKNFPTTMHPVEANKGPSTQHNVTGKRCIPTATMKNHKLRQNVIIVHNSLLILLL
jgi:hypothetical protein